MRTIEINYSYNGKKYVDRVEANEFITVKEAVSNFMKNIGMTVSMVTTYKIVKW